MVTEDVDAFTVLRRSRWQRIRMLSMRGLGVQLLRPETAQQFLKLLLLLDEGCQPRNLPSRLSLHIALHSCQSAQGVQPEKTEEGKGEAKETARAG